MKKSALFIIVFLVILSILSSCKKDNTTTCSDSFEGAFEGTQRIFIGNIDLSKIGAVAPINDVLFNNAIGTDLSIQSELLDLVLTGNLNNINNDVLTLDSVRFVDTYDTIEVSTSLAPDGLLKLWDIRAGGTATLNCNTLTTDIKIKSCRTNFIATLDTFNNLIDLRNLNVSLKGTFERR